jgi:integrase
LDHAQLGPHWKTSPVVLKTGLSKRQEREDKDRERYKKVQKTLTKTLTKMGWVFHNRKDKEGKQAIVYQVYYNGDMFPITTGVKIKKVKNFSGTIKGDTQKTVKLDAIKKIILEAVDQAKAQLPYWPIDHLKDHINNKMLGVDLKPGSSRKTLWDYWEAQIQIYKNGKQFSNVAHNENSRTAIFKVLDREIFMDQLTKKHMADIRDALSPRRSPSTINGYFRDLRVLIKKAFEVDEIINKNPLVGFKMPGMRRKTNVALTLEELQLFQKVEPLTEYQELVKDSSLFMYYCFGMRVTDMIMLTTKNIKGKTITYKTSKNKREFSFTMLPEAQKIVSRWKGDHFIFPYMNQKLKDQALPKKIALIRKSMRQTLNYMGKRAGITKKLGSHVFRHTWNFIQSAHLTLQERQRGLGHGSALTTEQYDKTMPVLDNLINQTKR